MSSDWPYRPAVESRLGVVGLTVSVRSSSPTFVELFHRCFSCRLFTVEFASGLEILGEESGVRLWLYLCVGRSGVTGSGGGFPRKENTEVRWRRIVGTGSDDGARDEFLLMLRGVTGDGDGRVVPVIFRANFRNGDIDLEIVLEVLGARVCDDREPLGGVAKNPFRVDMDVVPDVLDPFSLGVASPLNRILRTPSISTSVLDIRSLKFRQRWADSACRRRVSPFFVTRSWTPLSMMERTLDVAGI